MKETTQVSGRTTERSRGHNSQSSPGTRIIQVHARVENLIIHGSLSRVGKLILDERLLWSHITKLKSKSQRIKLFTNNLTASQNKAQKYL